MYHAPTPPSYYTIDWEDEGYQKRHAGLMIAHGIFMCLAFFFSIPVGIALRSVKHPLHAMATVSFYAFCALGCAASGLYKKLTPNMYEGAVHSKQGYLIILVAISLSALDIYAFLRRVITFFRSTDRTPKAFWRYVVKKETLLAAGPEYSGIVTDEPEEFNSSKLPRESVELEHIPLTESAEGDLNHSQTEQWANTLHQHRRHFSTVSEGTLFSPHSQETLDIIKSGRGPLLHRIGQGAFAVVERSLVLAGFAQLLVGIVTYTGGCRQNYINGCLAHLIKGAIFWSYGLLTFARYLGSFADLGWSWNRSPLGNTYTAEFVESFVIFFYGATNMWMERFGAKAGDPFTTKQIQHIGIAVMFCFAGLVGMGIESRRIRKWLASSTFASLTHPRDMPQEAIEEPISYMGSFNPFPALVIGVTGAAMAAHAQTYLFQVQIHELWGNLLVAFSVLRCLTYFFLWLGPSRSILPSRPPTEALGSFFLACGGLVFMFSTEEVTIAAMRRGRDDVMMFLNVAVALTCLAFCWTLAVVGFKGWIKSRTHSSVTYRNPA
ncbi:hypothetical protein BDN70DRAFT_873090 [Pholiota conissans]|uniref:Uncharacterized protein n=1 Tax=Pholiota conissans TaxID=109636 RepID=A0A9P5ZCG9_9AGAR|nr:hypothetical protein BDN70DRAFT_873090 [Pholiota conissans]